MHRLLDVADGVGNSGRDLGNWNDNEWTPVPSSAVFFAGGGLRRREIPCIPFGPIPVMNASYQLTQGGQKRLPFYQHGKTSTHKWLNGRDSRQVTSLVWNEADVPYWVAPFSPSPPSSSPRGTRAIDQRCELGCLPLPRGSLHSRDVSTLGISHGAGRSWRTSGRYLLPASGAISTSKARTRADWCVVPHRAQAIGRMGWSCLLLRKP